MKTRSARLAAVAPFVITLVATLCVGCGGDGSPPGDDGGVTQCTAHTQCDDGLFCNGAEQCTPSSVSADAEGCVPGAAACIANMTCDEAADSCGTVCTNGDMDGDGHDAVACGGDDCDDQDADRFPGNAETCDDGAGGQHDEDCDPATFGTTDRDGDGEVASSCCNTGSSGPNCGTDCDDTTIRRRSGQVEFCDSADNDCDGRTDEQTQDVPWYPDSDGDGFGTGTAVVSCTPVAGHSLASTDCDDTRAQEHPAQLDICDLSDNNCNTAIDELPICDVVQRVGAAGATLTTTATGGGTIRVQIPAGALTSSTPIAVGELHPRALPGLATGESFVGRPVAISPYGQAFSVPANVTLPAAGQNLAVLRLSDEDDTTWEVVEATFTGGQALFEVDGTGVYVVATKTCTAVTETCDSADNDCDWLVDEEDVCGGETLAGRIEGWWTYCNQFEAIEPSLQVIESSCAGASGDLFRWIAASGELGFFFEGECSLEGRWSTPGGSTLEVRECVGTPNESADQGVIHFVGPDDRYMVVEYGPDTEYEVFERLDTTPPASCEGTPVDPGDCGSELDPCPADWHVSDGACVQCPAGSTNEAGDDPAGVDTSCDVITCEDAGAPIQYRIGTLTIPTPSQANAGATIGHNVDFQGNVCGVIDYAGGVDNSLIDFEVSFASLTSDDPWSLQSEIDASLACAVSGSTCRRLDLVVHVATGTNCAIVEITQNQNTLMGPAVGTIDGAGNFRVLSDAFFLAIPIRTDTPIGPVLLDFDLSSVTINGTASESAVSDLVISGYLRRTPFEASWEQVFEVMQPGGGETAASVLAGILANLYDIQEGAQCSGLSVGLLGNAPLVP